MAQQVQLPDGSIGEFPDGMKASEIETVLQKQFPPSLKGQERPQIQKPQVDMETSALGKLAAPDYDPAVGGPGTRMTSEGIGSPNYKPTSEDAIAGGVGTAVAGGIPLAAAAQAVGPKAINLIRSHPIVSTFALEGAKHIPGIGPIAAKIPTWLPLLAGGKPEASEDETAEAVANKTANWIPTKIKAEKEIDPVKQAILERRAAPMPVRVPASRMAEERAVAPTVVPEPRANFPGENPEYMASVKRNDLIKMAKTGKPGAGTQLQQLGKPVIYAPREAGYPPPREVIPMGATSQEAALDAAEKAKRQAVPVEEDEP